MQVLCGSPGLDRTADTRFRKHEEGVIGCGGQYAKVLHDPRFWAGFMLSRVEPCWAVVGRLVGIAAAVGGHRRIPENR